MEAVGAVANVLELGKTAWAISAALYKLYRDTQNVNQTVEYLAKETRALAYACETIHEELREIVGDSAHKTSLYDKDGHLWLRISEQTKECEVTLGKLSAIVDKVQEHGSNIFEQGRRQIRLNMRQEEIAGIRSRVQTHTQSLQTILLVVNM